MSTLKISSLSNALPEKLQAPALLTALINYLGDDELSIEEEELKKLHESIVTLTNSESINAVATSTETTLEAFIQTLSEERQSKIKESDEYKAFQRALSLIKQFTTSVNDTTSITEKEIDFDKKLDSSGSEGAMYLSVEGDTAFNLRVLSAEEEKIYLTPLSDKPSDASVAALYSDYQVINQDIRAGLGIELGGNATLNVLSVGASVAGSKSVEIDTYFRVKGDKELGSALWQMYKRPVRFWSVGDLSSMLVSGSRKEGYCAVEVRAEGSMTVKGTVSLGQSIEFSADGKDSSPDVDIASSLGVSLAREVSQKGDTLVRFTKNLDDKVVLEVLLNEKDSSSTVLTLNAGAEITGLDKIASGTVKRLFDDADKVIDFLEEYQNPATSLQEILESKLDTDKEWMQSIFTLVTGETTASDTIDSLLLETLQEEFDKTPLSLTTDSNEQAKKLLEKLLSRFAVNLEPDSGIDTSILTEHAEQALSEAISNLKGMASEKLDELKSDLNDKLAPFFEPLETLGGKVKTAVKTIDTETAAKLSIILDGYNTFKSKVTKALEKSASIKLKLQMENSRESTDSIGLGYTAIIEEENSPLVQLFLRAVLLGDEKKAANLLYQLDGRGLTIIERTTQLQALEKSTTTLTVDIFDVQMKKVIDVTRDLVINVDPTGCISIAYKFKGQASAEGLGESRKTLFNLTYDVVRQAMSPEQSGSIGFSYINTDDKLHTPTEIYALLASLDLSKSQEGCDFSSLSIQPIVSDLRVRKAIERYKALLTMEKFTPSSSVVSIKLRPGNTAFEALLNLDPNAITVLGTQIQFNSVRYARSREQLEKICQLHGSMYEDHPYKWLLLYEDDKTFKDYYVENVIEDRFKRKRDFEKYRDSFRVKDDKKEYESWDLGIKRLVTTLQAVYSLAQLGPTLREVAESTKGIGDLNQASMDDKKQFLAKVKEHNKTFDEKLGYWLDAKSAVADVMDDIANRIGLKLVGINSRTLCLMYMIQLSAAQDSVFEVLITLSNANGEEKTIIV